MAKDYFKNNGIEYEERDVQSDMKARTEMMDKSGQLGVPVVEVNGKIIVGFDKDALDKEFGKK
jgi:glutaredoxin